MKKPKQDMKVLSDSEMTDVKGGQYMSSFWDWLSSSRPGNNNGWGNGNGNGNWSQWYEEYINSGCPPPEPGDK